MTLFVLFLLVIPVLILYAVGYRLDNFYSVISTGGIFVSTEQSGVLIRVDNTLEKWSNLFQRSFLLSSLKAGNHSVVVTKDGYVTWTKTVPVFAEKVTQINPFLVPKEITLIPVNKYLLPNDSNILATSTKELLLVKNKVINPEYEIASQLFVATRTKPVINQENLDRFVGVKEIVVKQKTALWKENDKLLVHWLGATSSAPYYFCVFELCGREVLISTPSGIKYFDFYPGRNDLVLYVTSLGMYISEIDNRGSAQNLFPLVLEAGVTFRVSEDENIYVKTSQGLFRLDL